MELELGELDCVDVAVVEAEGLAEELGVRVLLPVKGALRELEGEPVTVVVAAGVSVAACEAVAVGVCGGLTVIVGVGAGVPLCAAVSLAVPLWVGAAVTVLLCAAVEVSEGCGVGDAGGETVVAAVVDEEGVSVGRGVAAAELDGGAVTVEAALGVGLELRVSLGETEAVPESVSESLDVPLADELCVAAGVLEALGELVRDGESDDEELDVPLQLGEGVLALEREGVAAGEPEPVFAGKGELEGIGEAAAKAELVEVRELDAVRDALLVEEAAGALLAEGVCESDAEALRRLAMLRPR